MEHHTLFAFPFACSMAVHQTLLQHRVPFELQWMQRGPLRKVKDVDYDAVNPKRKVPALRLPDGEVLTEAVGVLLYLDETYAGSRPPAQRRRLIEWLSFVATELHQQVLGPAFDLQTPEAVRLDGRRMLPPVLAHLEQTLTDRETLLGDAQPSGADAYAFWALTLLRNLWPETVSTPALTAYRRRMRAHDFVGATLQREREAMMAAAG